MPNTTTPTRTVARGHMRHTSGGHALPTKTAAPPKKTAVDFHVADFAARAKMLHAEADEIRGHTAPTFSTLGDQLVAVARAGDTAIDKRLVRAPQGLSEGVPQGAGFLLAPAFVGELIESLWAESLILPRCTELKTGKPFADAKINAIDETSRANGSRYGSMQAAWAGEADTVTGTVPKIRQIELTGRKLMGIVAATNELMADAPLLGSHITKQFGLEFAFKFGDAIFNGTGAGLPLGVMNSTAKVTIAKESGQSAATIVKANIDNMLSRLPADSRGKAVWLINGDVEPQLNALSGAVGTGGQWIYREPGDSPEAPFATLMGLPVIAAEFCAALGTEGDIALVDWSQYLLVNAGLQVAVSAHVAFETDETHFRFVMRVAGAPAWTSPITPFRGTLTKSPYITLATR